MKLNALTLSFGGNKKKLEASFREDYFSKSIKLVRFALLLSTIFYGIFGILDAVLLPEMKGTLWFIRYAIICPIMLGVLLFSFSPRFKRYMHFALAGAITIAGLGIIVMIVISPPPVNFSYYAGLILVLMVGYAFMRVRFIWATLSGWIIVAFYEVAAIWLSHTPLSVLINNNFFFITANIIGMFTCYSLELYARRDFYLARLLQREREKVNTANRELENRVRVRTSQLMKANLNLKREIAAHERSQAEKKMLEDQLRQAQKMEAIGTLAGGIAHDFNNILAAIMGYTEMALFDVPADVDISRKLGQVLKATQRAKELVNQILTFSRQNEQERKPIQVNRIVKEALKLLRASLPSTIEIRQDIRSSSGVIMGDPTQIHQVLMNLCTNAAHAMRKTGGELGVGLLDANLGTDAVNRFVGLRPGPYLRITVSDTGPGMGREVLERIFEPFFTTKKPGEGTGMGLSVVHGIVQSHGGAITVESKPGKGTTIDVFLPVIEHSEKAGQTAALKIHSPGNERILLVDDEQALADMGKQMLEYIGYNVVVQTSSIEALELFREKSDQFDLVITDMTMPNMTGDVLATQLLSVRPDIPVILCTGYSEIMNEEKAKEIGIKDFVMKPLALHDLSRTIRKVLDDAGNA